MEEKGEERGKARYLEREISRDIFVLLFQSIWNDRLGNEFGVGTKERRIKGDPCVYYFFIYRWSKLEWSLVEDRYRSHTLRNSCTR